MKILFIITGNWGLDPAHKPNIASLAEYSSTVLKDDIVHFAGISMQEDFYNYEHIIKFEFKEINKKQILSRLCDFINNNKEKLDYDWYVLIRPEITLLETINFDNLCKLSINGRSRMYRGPRIIKYGSSVGGEGMWKNVGDYLFYNETESLIVLDDQFIIFHNNIIQTGLFTFPVVTNSDKREAELCHDAYYKNKNINKNIMSINLFFKHREGTWANSGNINC